MKTSYKQGFYKLTKPNNSSITVYLNQLQAKAIFQTYEKLEFEGIEYDEDLSLNYLK